MSVATRDTLLSKVERRFTTVDVDGVTYRLRSLNAAEFARIQGLTFKAHSAPENSGELMTKAHAMAIRMCLVDDDGEPLLIDADVDKLEQIDRATFAKLADACGELINDVDPEEIAKN